MTIDEAIEMYKKIANTDSNCPRYCMNPCEECVNECKQVSEWLEELKKRRSEDYGYMADIHQSIGYRNAIDDFVKALCIEYAPVSDEMQNEYDNVCLRFEKIAEQLKAGESE